MSIHRKSASSTGETGRKRGAEGENVVKTRTRRLETRAVDAARHPSYLRGIRGRVKARQGRITLASFRWASEIYLPFAIILICRDVEEKQRHSADATSPNKNDFSDFKRRDDLN